MMMQALLEALCYKPVRTYMKRRETWCLDDLEISLDTTAIGFFCEIEGPQNKILAIRGQLGLSDDLVEPRGYSDLLSDARRVQKAD